eukprot:Phypoly_transcript_00414.p1 GENE.Phypoly_transcript_00414~~Phypoly_transcript_00414.p1  ORF type:complete len:1618 (+),score=237.56 Phypoly_transcript_00414:610-4854(+)
MRTYAFNSQNVTNLLVANNIVQTGGFTAVFVFNDFTGLVGSRQFLNNTVENMAGSTLMQMIFSAKIFSPSAVIFMGNVVRNISVSCSYFYGFSISGGQYSLQNNIIDGVYQSTSTLCQNLQLATEPYIIAYKITNSTVNLVNSQTSNFHALYSMLDRPSGPVYDLVGVYLMASSILISDCEFSGFYGAVYPNCKVNECDPTFANHIVGVLADSPDSPYITTVSSVVVANTRFSAFHAGNGGDIENLQTNYVPGEMRGGDAVGIFSGLSTKISVRETAFSDFSGGKGGVYVDNPGPEVCSDGAAILVAGPGPIPSLKNVTGLGLVRTCTSNILQCGHYQNLTNAHLIIPAIKLDHGEAACLAFTNCQNILLESDPDAPKRKMDNFPVTSPIAIYVQDSSNFTISSLGFTGVSVQIQDSSDVILSKCAFVGYSNSSAPPTIAGVFVADIKSLVLVNNSFLGNSGVNAAGNVTNIFVYNNLFTSTILTESVNASLALLDVGNFTISGNQFVGTMSDYVIFANSSSPSLSSGWVADNAISGGSVTVGISVSGSANASILRNSVSRITGNCISFAGIIATGISTIQFSDNVVDNFYSVCPTSFIGMQLLECNIAIMNNNTISDFSVMTASYTTYTSTYFGLVLSSTFGLATNSTVKNLYLGSSRFFLNMTLTGVLHIGDTIMNGLVVQNLTVNKTLDCVGCNYTPGAMLIGVVSFGDFRGNNILMSDFRAGDAGVDLDPTTDYLARGGDVTGIYVVSNYSVVLSNAIFKNFKAGNGVRSQETSFINSTKCAGGIASYYRNNDKYYGIDPYPLLPPNVYQLEAWNFVNGMGCVDLLEIDPPTNASVVYTRTSYTLSWSPSPAANLQNSPMYTVDTQSSDGRWTSVYSQKDFSYTASNLLSNTTYHARLAATTGSLTSSYIYFIVTTLPSGLPVTSAPFYKEFSVDSITLTWTVLDTGGFPTTRFVLQMWNTSNDDWTTLSQGPDSSYKKTGLQPNTPYTFRVRAASSFGVGSWSENATISTAARACGDGNCDASENCTTCYLDCGSCGYQPCPGSPVCNGGTCVSGVCECPSGRSGPACEFSSTPIVVAVNDTSPTSTISVDNGGQTTGNTQFTLAFRTIQEVDSYGDTIKMFDLGQQQFVVLPGNSSNSFTETSYNTTLSNGAVLLIHLFVVTQDSNFLFANQSIHVSANSVKYSMEIVNWPFLAYNNKLKVTMESKGGSQQPKDDCVGVTPQTDNSDNLLWIKVTVNGAVLYGKFSNFAEIDGVVKVVQFFYNETSALIETIIPFFWDQAVFDPNFQVLLDPASSDDCLVGDSKKKSNDFTNGKIAGIVVGVVFGIAILVAVTGYIIMRRKRAQALQQLRSSSDIPLEEQPMKESKPKKSKNKEKPNEKREGEQASIIEKRPDMEAHTAAGTFKVDFE